MRNEERWRPTFTVTERGAARIHHSMVYSGSLHVARLQVEAYTALIRTYASGHLLDAGCGRVPYFEVYRPLTETRTCADLDPQNQFADEVADFEKPLPWADASFDTILLLDVLGHTYRQRELVAELGRCMKPGGHLILTTPFVYWISSYPHEYFHPTETALRLMCEEAGMEIVHLQPYGGWPDVLLDTLNKGMTGRWSNRLFRLFASLLIKTRWYHRTRSKTLYSYPLGYTLVARRI